MCVTNTTTRRPKPLSLSPVPNDDASNACTGSDLSKRLAASFAAPAMSTAPVKAPCLPKCATKKRRRKPQQPGFTAKHNQRHFVVHNYTDHSNDIDDTDVFGNQRKGGTSFPIKLHAVLEQVEIDGLGHIIGWQSHGRCFVIHEPKIFVAEVMPK